MKPRSGWARRGIALAAATAVLTITVPALATTRPSWQQYVEAPASRVVQPTRVVSSSGTVDNPSALVSPAGDGETTLTYVPDGEAPTIVLDFGQDVGGFPRFDVAAASGAPTLRAGYSETLATASSSGDMVNETNAVAQRFDTLPITGPGVVSGVELQGGERYEVLTLLTPGTVTLRSVSIDFTGYLGTPDALRGWFESSDDLLNRVWYAGVYTLNLNQVLPGTSPGPQGHDADLRLLLDGAKRDRSVWVGDIAMSGKAVYAALDPRYVRDSLDLVGRYPATVADYLVPAAGLEAQPGPMAGVCQPYSDTPFCLAYSMSYSTLFVPDLYDYFVDTADLGFVQKEWPNVTRLLAWNAAQLDANGLLPTSSTNGRDWNGSPLTGDVAWTNIVYYQALQEAAELANHVEPTAAAGYRAAAASLAVSINRQLWNDKLGVYDVSDSIRGAVAQDANVFAIITGLATPSQTARILAALNGQLTTARGMHGYSEPVPAGIGQTISPFMSGFQVLADFQSGHSQDALDLIRREWQPQVEGDPSGTVWEIVPETGGLPGERSAAHSWATGPTAALSEYVLGVSATSPGFATTTIAPQPGDLRWARGAVPTPNGTVDVDWQRTGCTFDLKINVPAGITATATLPGTQHVATATVDGARVTRSDTSGDLHVQGLSPGSHRLTARQTYC